MKQNKNTIDHIMRWYYKEKDFQVLFLKHCEIDDLVDDARQHIAEIIIKYDRDKIIEMYEKNQLKYFIIKIIKNQLHSTSSSFYYIHIKDAKQTSSLVKIFIADESGIIIKSSNIDKYSESIYIQDNDMREMERVEEMKRNEEIVLNENIKKYLKVKEKKSTQDYHDTQLYKLYYYDNLSYRKIQKQTNIHYCFAHRAVRRVHNEIIERFAKEIYTIKNTSYD